MYSIFVEDKFGINRDELIRLLEKKGIETRPFFYPMHVLPPYKTYENTPKISKNISSRGLNLPSSPTLEKSQIEFIVESFSKMVEGNK
jgi:perosamine synthetase